MAYAAVISLKQTIHRLKHSSNFSLDSSAREILELAHKEATSLQQVLIRVDDGGNRLDSLDGQIRDAVQKLEDFLELHQSNLFLEALPSHPPALMLLDSEQLRREISLLAEAANKLAEDYVAPELDNSLPDQEQDGRASSSNLFLEASSALPTLLLDGLRQDGAALSSNTGSDAEMVGFSDELKDMKQHVTKPVRPEDSGVLVIVGPAGTGRSLIAKTIFDDVGKNRQELTFESGVWVRIGSNYQRTEILGLILTQVLKNDGRPNSAGWATTQGLSEKKAKHAVNSILAGRRYMIVLEDVCDTQILDYLFNFLPMLNGSVVLVTTGEMEIAVHTNGYSVSDERSVLTCICIQRVDDFHIYREVQQNYFWDIMRKVLLPSQPVSPEMEEAGKTIVGYCRGLDLCFSKALLFLWTADTTPEAWNQIAYHPNHPIFNEIVDELSEMRKIKEDLANLKVEPTRDKTLLTPFVLDNGRSVIIKNIKKMLFPEIYFPKMEVISFVGMAGIGKTTFVREIFKYLKNLDIFNHYAYVWITLGPKYRPKDILVDILTQIYPNLDKIDIQGEAEVELSKTLSDKRFLIVLDDAWSTEPLDYLAKLFPDIKGRALLTTRLLNVANSEEINIVREMRLLTKEESWNLLRRKVFGEGVCPYELEKAGKKIAGNCDGLPLTVVNVANLLAQNVSVQYWEEVANRNSDFTAVLKELSEDLLPWYESLPQYLKPCFLYMGIFPQEYEVSAAKVIDLWIAEGFLEPGIDQSVEDFSAQCLQELVNRSFVMVCRKGTGSHKVKTCRLNSVMWHLSNSEALKNKFFHGLNTYDSKGCEGNQRRISIRNCILLMIKEINDDLMMDSSSTAHSLLCIGNYHQYPLPLRFELKLLRVLDTQAIRFYEFPVDVVKLIHLRHLAITCDGKVPSSISKLWNLRFFLVSRHLRIVDPSRYLPLEIWDMKELQHLEVVGSNLPNPTCGAVLPNLVTLLDVGLHSCTKEVLKGIPNLKRLGIEIEFTPDFDDALHVHYLNHISDILSKLESLECVVMNPEVVALPPPPVSMFPSNLGMLSLSGLGYPWEYMNIIGGLINLKSLELRCYAFQGQEWETEDFAFKKLEHLVIEDTDLVRWKSTVYTFSKLRHLSIKHCYNLEELPYILVYNIKTVEVVDCNPFTENWTNQIAKRIGHRPVPTTDDKVLRAHVDSSWNVGPR